MVLRPELTRTNPGAGGGWNLGRFGPGGTKQTGVGSGHNTSTVPLWACSGMPRRSGNFHTVPQQFDNLRMLRLVEELRSRLASAGCWVSTHT